MHPPARAPKPTFTEKNAHPAKVIKASRLKLPLIMTAKISSSLIVIIAFTDLPAGYYIYILETGSNTDE